MRILIADDHALFRSSLRSLVETKGYTVVGEAETGEEALELVRQESPDVVLMDLQMPGIDGFEATRRIAAEHPGVKVVVLTGSFEEADLLDALRAGACGYLLKTFQPERFFAMLDRVERGETVLPEGMAGRALRDLARGASPARRDPTALTERELQTLAEMAAGHTGTRELARRMGVSENTVKFHVRNILEKLQLASRAQAVVYALRHNLVRVDRDGRQGG